MNRHALFGLHLSQLIGAPVFRTSMPRPSPSVGIIDTERTQLFPRSWATSSTTRWSPF
jgi:hypothetical protein